MVKKFSFFEDRAFYKRLWTLMLPIALQSLMLASVAVVMWGLAIPLALLCAFVLHLSPVVVFACTCLDEVGKLPWVYAHFKKYRWVKDLTR